LLSFLRLPLSSQYILDELPSLIIVAFGLPASIGLTLAATSGIKSQESGAVSGILNTAQQIGGPLILAILATVSATYTASVIATSTGPASLLHGIHAAFTAAACFVLLAAVLCIVLIKKQASKSDRTTEATRP
jgi:sugar phosphate permease